jgi:signal transduction histidine kinase
VEGAPGEGWFVFNEVPTVTFSSPQKAQGQWKQGKQQIENWNARQRAMNRHAGQVSQQNVFQNPSVTTATAEVSHLVPLWIGTPGAAPPFLVLVRRVRKEGRKFLQGVLVDWPKLRAMAKEEVKDLFPEARLLPRNRNAPDDPDRTLAVLPAMLEPGRLPEVESEPAWTPVRIGLLSIWAAFVCGTLVVGAGLRSLLALNRRRLDFVSAVTHELRTPLTTFRMYAEMLKDGMVPEGKSRDYFVTLHEESQRLSHLVQNVLDYSRLESDRLTPKRESAPLGAHLERSLPTLRERCESKGVGFRAPEEAALDAEVSLDASALGQILFNLVDNACKYGEGEVALSASSERGRVRFTVSDGGRGIDGAEARRIFSPFARGRDSETRGPGVGLGLALCRRWAREMGGDLRLEGGEGARFVLDLPAR